MPWKAFQSAQGRSMPLFVYALLITSGDGSTTEEPPVAVLQMRETFRVGLFGGQVERQATCAEEDWTMVRGIPALVWDALKRELREELAWGFGASISDALLGGHVQCLRQRSIKPDGTQWQQFSVCTLLRCRGSVRDVARQWAYSKHMFAESRGLVYVTFGEARRWCLPSAEGQPPPVPLQKSHFNLVRWAMAIVASWKDSCAYDYARKSCKPL